MRELSGSLMEYKIYFETVESIIDIHRFAALAAFPEPYLNAGRIPDEVWFDLRDMKFNLAEWAKLCQAVNCDNDSIKSVDDVKSATILIDESDQFKTPARKRKRDPNAGGGSCFGNDWVVVSYDRVLLDDPLRSSVGSAVERDPIIGMDELTWGQ
jgi:hypothetical protein